MSTSLLYAIDFDYFIKYSFKEAIGNDLSKEPALLRLYISALPDLRRVSMFYKIIFADK